MNQPNLVGVILVALGAALPVAIIQPAVVALPALQAILVIASATVTAVALYLKIPAAE